MSVEGEEKLDLSGGDMVYSTQVNGRLRVSLLTRFSFRLSLLQLMRKQAFPHE